MFKALIDAHDLTHITTEPRFISEVKAETISELTEKVNVVVANDATLLHGGYCITVTISLVRE